MGLKASAGTATGLLGKQTAPENIGYLAKIIAVPKGSSFATDALALTESEWLDKINAAVGLRYISLPLFFEMTPEPEDDIYNTSSLGLVKFVREGLTTVSCQVDVTPFVMTQLRTLNGVEFDIFGITSEGFIIGTSVDGVKFQPFSLQNFRVGKSLRAGGDAQNLVPITFTYSDEAEYNDRFSFVNPLKEGTGGNWNPRDLKDPKALTTTITNPTIGGFDIYIEGYDKVPFEGAAKEDILIKNKATGAVVALTSLTENTPGNYTAVATIPADTYLIGFALVGTAGAVQGYAGLESDLNEVTTAV